MAEIEGCKNGDFGDFQFFGRKSHFRQKAILEVFRASNRSERCQKRLKTPENTPRTSLVTCGSDPENSIFRPNFQVLAQDFWLNLPQKSPKSKIRNFSISAIFQAFGLKTFFACGVVPERLLRNFEPILTSFGEIHFGRTPQKGTFRNFGPLMGHQLALPGSSKS